MKAFFISIITFFFLFGCKNQRVVVSENGPVFEFKINSKTPEELFGVWMNSYEEEKPNGESIYRPKSFDFPLSRGRSGMEFLENGTFYEIYPGPNDAPLKTLGNWIYSAKTKSIEITFPEPEAITSTKIHIKPKSYTLLLIFISKDILSIKKLGI